MSQPIHSALRRLRQDLRPYLDEAAVGDLCKPLGHRGRRDALLSPFTTLLWFVIQVLQGNTALTHLTLKARRAVSESAYCQARARLPLTVFRAVLRFVTRALVPHTEAEGRWRGHRTFLVDGSSFSMPDTPELQRHFGQPGGQAAGCGFPVATILALFHAGTGLLLDVLAAPLRMHDMGQVDGLHPALRPGDVLVGDRGLGSFAHLALLLGRGAHAVFRVHQEQIVDILGPNHGSPDRLSEEQATTAPGTPRRPGGPPPAPVASMPHGVGTARGCVLDWSQPAGATSAPAPAILAAGVPMLAKLSSFTLQGIEAVPVEVEVDVSSAAMPKTVLVGLAEAAVRESTHRVERALVNSGFRRPTDRIVINLAPADIKKDAGGFDLPIALGLLVGSGQLAAERPGNFAVVGELALTGEARPIKGALAMALAAAAEGRDGLLVPAANAAEAAVVEGVAVYPIGSLAEAVGFLAGALDVEPTAIDVAEVFQRLAHTEEDFVDVKGQDYAKRAMVIAASGGHNVLMVGPPGTGKTLLARRLGSIMPPLTPAESLETTRIYSAMGLLRPGQPLMAVRPFRSPHHSVSDAGLVGGGSTPQPGEISLAHKGVLFLDELPEFNRKTLEVLRQPLEEGRVTISRALRSTTFPADFILVAAMNPCPCGYRSDPRRACTCSPPQVERYLAKISGPLLDRIDLHVEVPAVPFAQLAEAPPGPTSAQLLEDVLRARARQAERFGPKGPAVNGRMTPRQVRKYCALRPESASILKGAMEELGLSARAHDKILRVARTMADLDGDDPIGPHHIAEAVGFRSLDRSVFA